MVKNSFLYSYYISLGGRQIKLIWLKEDLQGESTFR